MCIKLYKYMSAHVYQIRARTPENKLSPKEESSRFNELMHTTYTCIIMDTEL